MSIITSDIQGVIPNGKLNEQEYQYVATIIQQIKSYSDEIIQVTNNLFTAQTPFDQDLATLTQLRGTIATIHTNITRTGSPFAQYVIAHLKGLTQHLMDAQIRWVETLKTKNLLTMGSNRGFMSARYEDARRFIFGAKNGNSRTGEGLIGCFEKAQHLDLKKEITALNNNIDFIFLYAPKTGVKEIDLALNLINHKGFTPTIISSIAWLLQ